MRLIDADAFLAGEIKRCHCVPLVGSCEKDYEPLTCILDQEPSIDAVPVVRGRWILHHTVTGNPYVDAVPVVRCKDCKHYRNYPDGLCYLCAVCVEPDDFCSYGERR